MDNQQLCSLFVILVCMPLFCYGQYQIPEILFEVFKPRGLRISIPADQGVELFGFHGKINKAITQIEPGDISQDVTKPTNGRFTYLDPNLALKENDVINYWVFVQHDQLGFRKDDQSWTVNRLLPEEYLTGGIDSTCQTPSITKIEGQDKVCPRDTIISYQFAETPIDSYLWLIEQYIPGHPDWPFNIYQNIPQIVDVKDSALRITPTYNEDTVQKDLNVDTGCTRKGTECHRNYVSIWNPPIISGQLRLKKAFSFGNITIRAKLPIGDYLYPEIYLEDITNPERRIIIAYARGNKDYISQKGVDIGGKMLFGGPHTSVREPKKSEYLSSYQSSAHIGEQWHTFTLLWTPDLIDLWIDGEHFGHHNAQTLQNTGFNKEQMVRLVLGVGAGGPYHFPDGYTSSGQKKAYINPDPANVKAFVKNKAIWTNSWTKNSQLQVDYVSVTAL